MERVVLLLQELTTCKKACNYPILKENKWFATYQMRDARLVPQMVNLNFRGMCMYQLTAGLICHHAYVGIHWLQKESGY